MEIEIEEVVKDEYELIGKDGFVYGHYDTIDKAVKFMKNYSPKQIRYNGMMIRHKLTAYIDRSVDCAELVEKAKKVVDKVFHK